MKILKTFAWIELFIISLGFDVFAIGIVIGEPKTFWQGFSIVVMAIVLTVLYIGGFCHVKNEEDKKGVIIALVIASIIGAFIDALVLAYFLVPEPSLQAIHGVIAAIGTIVLLVITFIAAIIVCEFKN